MLVTTSDTWKTATPVDSNTLIMKVVRTYGLQDDEEAKTLALDCLDDTIKEFNRNTYEFNLMVVSGITITSGVEAISLPQAFYKEKQAYLVKTSDSKSEGPLGYIDWATFNRLYGINPRLASAGFPTVYTARNVQEEGQLYLGPEPSSSIAADYTLTVEYYRRIPLVSATDQLTIPAEVEPALLAGAQELFAIHISGADSQDAARFAQKKYITWDGFKEADRKHPDGLNRFRMYPWGRRNSTARPFYIRID